MATEIDIGPSDGGAGVAQLIVKLYGTFVNTTTALDYQVDNAKSPFFCETMDLTNGETEITLPVAPRKAGGLVIVPPPQATYTLKIIGATAETGIELHMTAPCVLCFDDTNYPISIFVDWAGPTWAAATSVAFSAADPTEVSGAALVGHSFVNNDRVRFSATTMPGGISEDTWYYVANKSVDKFELAETEDGDSIAATTTGTAVVMYFANRFSFYWF